MLHDKRLRELHVDVVLCLDAMDVFSVDCRELGKHCLKDGKEERAISSQHIAASRISLICIKEQLRGCTAEISLEIS